MNRIAFLFPGQGAQYPGMGRDFFEKYPEAIKIFDEAEDLLSLPIKSIIFDGPEEKLTRTEYSQLGIFIVSAAILKVLQTEVPDLVPHTCAGLSLGEYSALFASKRLSFPETLLLVQKRGQFMSEACEAEKGTMAAVVGIDSEILEETIKELQKEHAIWVANYNTPGQTVISGSKEAIEFATPILKEKGAKRVLPLQVHGAFHSGLMFPAQKKLSPYVKAAPIKESEIGLVMNVTGQYDEDVSNVKKNLMSQVTHSVRWQQSIETMKEERITHYIEIGCGKTLSGMNRKMGLKDQTLSIEKVEDLSLLEEFLKERTKVE